MNPLYFGIPTSIVVDMLLMFQEDFCYAESSWL